MQGSYSELLVQIFLNNKYTVFTLFFFQMHLYKGI